MGEKKKPITVFEKFKEQYRNGNVSVLIGAGMSKNVSSRYLLWNELMYDAAEYVYHAELSEKESEREKQLKKILDNANFLQLASDFISKKGFREAIDYYIESRTPLLELKDNKISLYLNNDKIEDVAYDHIDVHIALLRCTHFKNFYTTNYDNVLELASSMAYMEDGISLKVVKEGEALSNNHKGCIIKIHGSISERGENYTYGFDHDNHLKFIIASEDYATYIKKHEAFSYLMRIAMLQGVFCLIGFSGTDPNYLTWLSWMSDILQNSANEQTKIFMVDISGTEIPEDKKLFNKNHHIEILNLWDKSILQELFPVPSPDNYNERHITEQACVDTFDTRLRNDEIDYIELVELHQIATRISENTPNGEYYKKLYNKAKREILRRFFEHIYNEGNTREEISTITNGDRNLESNKTETAFLSQSFDYQEAWGNVVQSFWGSSKTLDMKSYHDWVSSKRVYRFAKYISRQDQAIDFMINMKSLSKDAASLFALAVTDVGLLPKFYSKIFPNDTELNKDPQWRKLLEREKTLNGCTDYIETNDDYDEYENIQRSLLNLDFKTAKKQLENWQPQKYWIRAKAVRLSAYPENVEPSLKLIELAVKQEQNVQEELFDLAVGNFIACDFPQPYNTDKYLRAGVDGPNALLNHMIQAFQKAEKPKRRGWVGTVTQIGGQTLDYEHGLRVLQFIIESGIYLAKPQYVMLRIELWYSVFKRMCKHFPYPCFFYSIQYGDKDVLRRIGEDFAFNSELQHFNHDILTKSLLAIVMDETPAYFRSGILNVIGSIYFAVDETEWFSHFEKSVFKIFLEHLNDWKSDDPIVYNVKCALGSIRNSHNIKRVFDKLLKRYDTNKAIVSDIIVNNLMIDHIDEPILLDNIDGIGDIMCSDTIDMMYSLNKEHKLSCKCRTEIIEYVKRSPLEQFPKDRFATCQLIRLVFEDVEALQIVKSHLLSMDMFCCGIIDNGELAWYEPSYVRMDGLLHKINWSDEEFDRIRSNISKNVKLYENASDNIKKNSFIKSAHIRYLSDMKRYISSLPELRRSCLSEESEIVEKLFTELTEFRTNISLMMSDQSQDVNDAFSNICEGLENNEFEAHRNDIDFLLDRAIMQSSVALTRNLKIAAYLVKNFSKEMLTDRYIGKLETLIAVYANPKAWAHLDLRFAFTYLHTIADALQQNGKDSETIKFWLYDKFVNRFVRF